MSNIKIEIGCITLLLIFFISAGIGGIKTTSSIVTTDTIFTSTNSNNSKNTINPSVFQADTSSKHLTVPLFGYRVYPTKMNPIERNQTAVLKIFQGSDCNTSDVILQIKNESYAYNSIQIEKNIEIGPNGSYIVIYHLSSPKNEFFMEIHSYFNLTEFNLACVVGKYQYNYDGILNNGVNNFQFLSSKNPSIETVNSNIPQISLNKTLTASYKDFILNHQKYDLRINNTKYFETMNTTSSTTTSSNLQASTVGTPTYYGIVDYEDYVNSDYTGKCLFPAQLPSLWKENSKISVGIYRNSTTWAQIKSDLQYYNTETFQGGHLSGRDVLAYEINCDGSHDDTYYHLYEYIYHWYWWPNCNRWTDAEDITPSDISGLWYESYDSSTDTETDVYPTNTIVLAVLCYGGAYGNMPDSWVNYGAAAYVAAIQPVTAFAVNKNTGQVCHVSDTFEAGFWDELCINGGTVADARNALVNAYNSLDIGLITWYDSTWDIYGNSGATL